MDPIQVPNFLHGSSGQHRLKRERSGRREQTRSIIEVARHEINSFCDRALSHNLPSLANGEPKIKATIMGRSSQPRQSPSALSQRAWPRPLPARRLAPVPALGGSGPCWKATDGEVCLIGSRLFCLRAKPSLDLIKVAKMYQAVLIP